uniref:F-box/kelch-repeat protein At3g23880-like n=1 Tax=Fragaria vesca subsp. vesca TaxID=101020 RepID=UPI0005C9F504|nr:PREDICTED: F-box/kelch-repeat protein At3g23880-like [Fragaria vesca subsp. vesca]
MSKKARVVVFDLPEDVVVNILCRLPVKSLIRFTCVSKRWRSIIISDSQFATSTFQLASQTTTLRQRLLLSCDRDYIPCRFQCIGDLDMPCFGGSSLVQSLTLPPEVKTERVMLASCNGLVVLVERLESIYTNNLFFWNPSTGFYRKIPSPENSMMTKLGSYTWSVSCGFGNVMAADEYKLVFFDPSDSAVHIFSTRDSKWKVIKFAPHSLFPEHDGRPLLVSNGACHWVSNGVPEPAVYAFDLKGEEFRQLPLPLLALMPEPDFLPAKQIATQVLREGCLCVSSRNWHGNVEFWEMKEYGVPESWVKLFHFSVQDLPDVFASANVWFPVLVTECGTVVISIFSDIFSLYGNRELVRIKCQRDEKPVCSGRIGFMYKFAMTIIYDETLLSV